MQVTPVTILADAESRVGSILVAHSKILQQVGLDEYTKEVANDILRFCYIMVVGLFEQYLCELVSQKVTTILFQNKKKTDALIDFLDNADALSSLNLVPTLDELQLYKTVKSIIKHKYSFLNFSPKNGCGINDAFSLIISDNILDRILAIRLNRAPDENDKILFNNNLKDIIDRRHRIAHVADYMSIEHRGDYVPITFSDVNNIRCELLFDIAYKIYETVEK